MLKSFQTPVFYALLLWALPLFQVQTHAQDQTQDQTQVQIQAQTHLHESLARHWAPVIYQQTDLRLPEADYLTRFDFDGDFDGFNNWENLLRFPLSGAVYYHVAETDVLFFVYLGLFHPRDWEPGFDNPFSSHENDLEDLILVIHKDGSAYGRLLVVETHAHFDFHTQAAPTLKAKHTVIEGPLPLAGHQPRVTVPPGGHGIYPLYEALPALPGILYQAGDHAEVPSEPSLKYPVSNYVLLPFDALWQRRDQSGPGTPYRSFGEFGANDYTWLNPASAPWIHDDPNDGPVGPGDLFSDPDYALRNHVSGLPEGQPGYLKEPLYTHRLALGQVQILSPVTTPRLSVWLEAQKLWETTLLPGPDGAWMPEQALRYWTLPPGTELSLQISQDSRSLASIVLKETAGEWVRVGQGAVWLQAALKRGA